MKTVRKSEEQTRFDSALRHVMSVSKEELKRREAEYQAENAHKPKRGPKPKTSASDRASRDV